MSKIISLEYNMQLLHPGHHDVIRQYDYLLTASGSDFRAYQILRMSRDFGVSFNKVLIFNFEERHDCLNTTLIKAFKSYEGLGLNTSLIGCSIKDPSTCVKALGDSDPDFKSATKVALDISCFTKPYFFCLLKYLKEQTNIGNVTVFYTEPMSYVFSKGLYQSYHSTSGPLSVMEIPGFPGNDTRTTKKVLVVLLGFDGELSSFITEEIAPDATLVVNGFPAYAPKFKEVSLINNEKLLISSATGSVQYSRANSPFETFNLLEHLYKKETSAFFNVAPIGTKPMALGACLFALVYPAVRIVYPLPQKYTDVTTRECWNSWSYDIPFSTI